MAKKTKIDSEKTRSHIIDAAEILFYNKGVSNTSLSDIASNAGVTRGAIYWHFKNKLDLFQAMHSRVVLPLENLQAEALNQPDPIISLRDFWIKSILHVIQDDSRRRVVEILFRKCEYVDEFEEAANRMKTWSSLVIEVMTGIFAEARNKHLLLEGVSPNTAAVSTYSFIVGIVYSWMMRSDIDDLAEMAPEIITVFFRSLHSPCKAVAGD